jgi:serine/threonine-protein kinase HipA
MARHQYAVIWTQISGTPEKMGELVLQAEQTSFTYTKGYLSSAHPGFCLLGDGAVWGTEQGKEPPPGLETEWQLLVMGGHGGIGHIDIFSDDIVARRWYNSAADSRDSVANW